MIDTALSLYQHARWFIAEGAYMLAVISVIGAAIERKKG